MVPRGVPNLEPTATCGGRIKPIVICRKMASMLRQVLPLLFCIVFFSITSRRDFRRNGMSSFFEIEGGYILPHHFLLLPDRETPRSGFKSGLYISSGSKPSRAALAS